MYHTEKYMYTAVPWNFTHACVRCSLMTDLCITDKGTALPVSHLGVMSDFHIPWVCLSQGGGMIVHTCTKPVLIHPHECTPISHNHKHTYMCAHMKNTYKWTLMHTQVCILYFSFSFSPSSRLPGKTPTKNDLLLSDPG